MLTRIKKLTGYTAHSRFLSECYAKQAGYIPRQADIPSPYFYSPVWAVLIWKTKRIAVTIVETGHRRYEVFSVPAEMIKKREKDCY